jgi:3-oxoacyl-[acyl-carrier-protein] synthase II
VKDFDPSRVASPKEVRKLERNVLLGLAAGREALDDAGLEGFDPMRVGIVFGSAIGGLPGIVEQANILAERGPDRVSPNFLPNVLVDSCSGQMAISLGIRGPNFAIVSACATGSHAVGEAAELIKRGDADAVIAGGTEACVHPLILAGFTAMRGLAVEDDDPPHASRPFDATRAGFVMSEGAGALLVEDWEHAERRGAQIYAEVLGYGASNDAHHMAQPEPEAVGVAAMMRAALERAGVEPEQVGYLNAHGTSTPQGDRRPRLPAGGLVYEVDDRPHLRRRRRDRGDLLGARAPRGRAAAHDQLPRARPGLRPRLRPERGAARPGRRGAVERDGAGRPQRLRPPRAGRLTCA